MSAKRRGPALPEGCPCSGLTLAKLLRPAIMSVLTKGPLHGYRLIESLTASPVMHGSRPDPTGVYRALRAMKNEGLVASSWDLAEMGPARRSYRLTARGRTCLGRWVETLSTYHRALGQLLRAARTNLRKSPTPKARRK